MPAPNYAALRENFHRDEIEWRIQSAGEKGGRIWALCVAYVTNRAIQQRLDEVVGPTNWQNEFRPGPDGGVICGLSVRVGTEWITKWDGAENTEIEGVKGGLSAAMKRAAVQWGIGRYLYDLGDSWANVHEHGRSRGKLKDGTAFRWDPPELPPWALPAVRPETPAEHRAMLEFIREVGARCEEQMEIQVGGSVHNLKSYIRENWQPIKEQYNMARSVVQAIEGSTGQHFRAAA